MKMMKSLIFGVAMMAAVPSVADEMRRETVRFATGSSSSTIKSSVKGYQTVQYALSVTAGQKMSDGRIGHDASGMVRGAFP